MENAQNIAHLWRKPTGCAGSMQRLVLKIRDRRIARNVSILAAKHVDGQAVPKFFDICCSSCSGNQSTGIRPPSSIPIWNTISALASHYRSTLSQCILLIGLRPASSHVKYLRIEMSFLPPHDGSTHTMLDSICRILAFLRAALERAKCFIG